MSLGMDRLVIWVGLGLVALGLVIVGLGLLLGAVGPRVGGRLLPGDIVISRPGFTLLLPITTSIVLSLLLMLLFSLIAAFRR